MLSSICSGACEQQLANNEHETLTSVMSAKTSKQPGWQFAEMRKLISRRAMDSQDAY